MAYTLSKTSNLTLTPITGLFVQPLSYYPHWEWIDEFLDAYYDAWPLMAYWRALGRVVIVDPAHPDAPPAFRAFLADGRFNPQVQKGCYFPGTSTEKPSIWLSTDFAAEFFPNLGHELGHHWEKVYTERIAEDIGHLFRRRLGDWPYPPGAIEVYAAEVQRA